MVGMATFPFLLQVVFLSAFQVVFVHGWCLSISCWILGLSETSFLEGFSEVPSQTLHVLIQQWPNLIIQKRS